MGPTPKKAKKQDRQPKEELQLMVAQLLRKESEQPARPPSPDMGFFTFLHSLYKKMTPACQPN